MRNPFVGMTYVAVSVLFGAILACSGWPPYPESETREFCDFDHDGELSLACGGGDCDDHRGDVSSHMDERCEGRVDENCNGTIDEGCECLKNGETRECQTDSEGRLVVFPGGAVQGTCKLGVQECVGRKWSSCQRVQGPQTEQCDGLDNDCDGRKDNGYSWQSPSGGIVPVTGPCTLGFGACRATGTVQCSSITQAICNARIVSPSTYPRTSPALNDSWDWNCDGTVTARCCEPGVPPASCGSCSRSPDGIVDVSRCTQICKQDCQGGQVSWTVGIVPDPNKLRCGDSAIVCKCAMNSVTRTCSAALATSYGHVACW